MTQGVSDTPFAPSPSRSQPFHIGAKPLRLIACVVHNACCGLFAFIRRFEIVTDHQHVFVGSIFRIHSLRRPDFRARGD
jgi:hypothetical protein